MAAERELDVVLEAVEEGGFVVSVPDLRGCWTQGETRDEALENAKEAIAAYLDALEELGKPLPKPTREHVKITESLLRVGSENRHPVRREWTVRLEIAARSCSGVHFRERAAAFPRRLCTTATRE